MMLLVFSLIAAAPLLGVSLWLIDESYGQAIAPRLRTKVDLLGEKFLRGR